MTPIVWMWLGSQLDTSGPRQEAALDLACAALACSWIASHVSRAPISIIASLHPATASSVKLRYWVKRTEYCDIDIGLRIALIVTYTSYTLLKLSGLAHPVHLLQWSDASFKMLIVIPDHEESGEDIKISKIGQELREMRAELDVLIMTTANWHISDIGYQCCRIILRPMKVPPRAI